MPLRHSDEPDRVRRYTRRPDNHRIDSRTLASIQRLAGAPQPELDARIAELRAEWSIERYLQLNAAGVGLATLLLAVAHDRRWAYVTCTALGFFLFHAIDGFDPPLLLLRRLGIRTRAEIDREIYALKALRGDFDEVEPMNGSVEPTAVRRAIEAVGA